MSGVRLPATGATAPLEPLDDLLTQQALLLGALPATGQLSSGQLYALLLLRDRIAAFIRDGKLPSLSSADKIRQCDKALRSALDRLSASEVELLQGLRDAVQPPEQNWWWYRRKFQNVWWTIGRTVFLTFSVTMLADVAHRVLTSDPDEAGIGAIALQAILAIAASSAFTERGRQWIDDRLLRKVPMRRLEVTKLLLTIAFFAVVFLGWAILPPLLARYYNHRGLIGDKTSFSARRYYQRAAALDPDMEQAHFNLGNAYEESFEYDKAIGEYQKALVVDSIYVAASANLSRLLVIENQPLTALRAADNGIASAAKHLPARPSAAELQIVAALRKDRAAAELQLGFYSAAEADATSAAGNPNVAPAAWCVLGKAYAKQNKAAEEREAWRKFHDSLSAVKLPTVIEPDCTRLAEMTPHETN